MYSVCTRLTHLYLLVEYKVFLHKVQVRVSALDNCNLQVVHEILKQLYKTYMGCLNGEGRGYHYLYVLCNYILYFVL